MLPEPRRGVESLCSTRSERGVLILGRYAECDIARQRRFLKVKRAGPLIITEVALAVFRASEIYLLFVGSFSSKQTGIPTLL